MTYILFTILLVFSVYIFFEPIVSYPPIKVKEELDTENVEELNKRKLILLKEMKDIEIEFRAGKLNKKEYTEIKNYLEGEILEIIKKLRRINERQI